MVGDGFVVRGDGRMGFWERCRDEHEGLDVHQIHLLGSNQVARHVGDHCGLHVVGYSK